MNFGVLSLAAGGFLLGGAYSIARLERAGRREGIGQSDPSQVGRRLRPPARLAVAAVLLLLAGYFIWVGILQLRDE